MAPAPARTVPWTWWAGVAASILIVTAAVITGVTLTGRSGGDRAGPTAGDPTAALPAVVTDFSAVEQEYTVAAELLLASIEQRLDRLDPATVATLRKNLSIIDQAIDEIRTALESAPADAVNGQMLAAMYQQKIQLLWRVSRLSS